MPPPGAAGSSFFGASATIASVVIIRPAMDAAFCSAERVTLVGSGDAELDHVAELAVGGVVAERAGAFGDAVQHHARLVAGVGDDLAQRGFHRAQGDRDAVVLVLVGALQLGDRGLGTDQGDAAARDDAFLDRRTGGMQGVFDARLLFLHLDFGGGADLDHRNAPRPAWPRAPAASRGRSPRWSPRSAP